MQSQLFLTEEPGRNLRASAVLYQVAGRLVGGRFEGDVFLFDFVLRSAK